MTVAPSRPAAVREELRFAVVNLEEGHSDLEACRILPRREYEGTFYAHPNAPLSIVALPSSGDEYEAGCSRCTRYNAKQARKRGYRYERIDRAEWEADLFELRSSARARQGRPMPLAYLTPQRYSSDAWPEPHCKRHLVTVHGVISAEGRLVAYAQLVQCGEIARLNTILGHAAYLEQGVMWLCLLEALKWHVDECGASFGLYYTHDSGGPGLRYWKERYGFRPTRATWVFS